MRCSTIPKAVLVMALIGGGCDEADAGGDDSLERFGARAADSACAGNRGMTWAKLDHDAQSGIDHVGCSACDPYSGDTSCATALPVLCIKPSGAAMPGALETDFYNGWTGGHIATTAAVPGTALTSLHAATLLCVERFGPGWRMAEFHDGGGGWTWYAFGEVEDTRFWVHINDQPSNCWNS
jgi:hypothetical protein